MVSTTKNRKGPKGVSSYVIFFRSRRIAIYSVLSTQPWFGDGSRHTAVSTFAGIPTIPWIPGFSVFFLWTSAVTGGLS